MRNVMTSNALAVFESKKIRRYFDEQTETWYFSVIDVVEALTISKNPTDYLKKLRKRDMELGAYIGTNCPQVEMITETGKKRKTLGGSVQHILRLVQSIPSPKAEPFKLWLTKVGYERIQDMSDPAAQTIHRLWWIKFVCPLWGPFTRPPYSSTISSQFNIISSIYWSALWIEGGRIRKSDNERPGTTNNTCVTT